MKRVKYLAAISVAILVALTVVQCGSRNSNNVASGGIENGVYTNDHFGFSIVLPGGWNVRGSDEIYAMQEAGREILRDDNAETVLPDPDPGTRYLLFVTRTDSLGRDYGLQVVTEEIGSGTAINDGGKYLVEATDLIRRLNLPYENFDTPVTRADIGGHAFYRKELKMVAEDPPMTQEMYADVIDAKALVFGIHYYDPQQMSELHSLLAGVYFSD